MGLDAGFNIKNDSTKLNFNIAYFRNFHELDDWIKHSCVSKINDNGILYEVTLEDLKRLKEDLLPIVQVLVTIPERLLSKYDDAKYPKKYKLDSDKLIIEEFNPIMSRSAFAGRKTVKLYNAVCTMIDILNDDMTNGELYIEYWSSY